MERWELRAIVDAELKHVPETPSGDQTLLRAAYNMARMHSLGRQATKKQQTAFDVLQDCIRVLRKTCPGACFCYDKGFFENSTHESRRLQIADS
jgi:hypothetical protein